MTIDNLTSKIGGAIILASVLGLGGFTVTTTLEVSQNIALIQQELTYLRNDLEGKTDQRWRRSDAELSHLIIENAISGNARRITALEFAIKNRNSLDIGVPD